jgi:histidinol-phosphate aminotransferase
MTDGLVRPPRARVHGGPDLAELRALGVEPTALLDFSVSTNPYGPHPSMLRALAQARLDRYPDPDALRGREALAVMLGTQPSSILLGHGAAELLWSSARALLVPGDVLLTVRPTFSELLVAARRLGAHVDELACCSERGFGVDIDALAERARTTRARVVYLCSPNTPTGAHVPASEVARVAATLPGCTVVLDQSFLSLSEAHHERDLALPENILVVRSLTKEHAIPGARVGYACAAPALLERVAEQRPAWMVGALCEVAAIAAPSLEGFVAESRQRVLEDRRALAGRLEQLELVVEPSCAGFVAVRIPGRGPASVRERLLRRHAILVRDCASFGLPEHVRIAARPVADRERLIAALRQELA